MNITRRELLAAAPAAFASRLGAQQEKRPNIILVLADDLAAWMLGCYGNQEIRTPNIDLLARSGMRFLNSYVATPVCSASRATLFTGRLPSQHGIIDFLTPNPIADPPQGQKEPPASFNNEVMVSDLLAQGGYRCGYVGKWHMGNDSTQQHRFEYWCTPQSATYQDPTFHLNGKQIQEKGFTTELLTDRALEFIGQQSADKPFFLVASYPNPHLPYSGHPEKYYKMYENVSFDKSGWEPPAANALREKELLQDTVGNIRKCAASVTALDDQIPRLLAKLDEKKMRDDTLIVFTGDNGFLLGRHGLWSKGLASNPINMYEEVMQVPMIWNWRGKTPPEIVRPELISFYDFLPTICDVANVPAPADRKLIGRSYAPIAFGKPFGKKEPRWTELAYGQYRNTEMMRDRRYKLVQRNQGAGPNELYDLNADRRERLNQHDNPQFVTVRDRLAAELGRWRSRVSS